MTGPHPPAPLRSAVLTTKHGKGPALAGALLAAGLVVRTVPADTDQLGTFSSELPRPGPALPTAVAKARLCVQLTGSPLGLASEGRFTPDPQLPWVTRDTELVVLVDDTTGATVAGRATSISTRTFVAVVGPDDDLTRALTGADLPQHAVIVRPNLGPTEPVHKALRTAAQVAAAVPGCAAASPDGRARIETDLRADRCPSRLAVIAAAAHDLATRLTQRCPACDAAGWGPQRTLTGLPCGWCAGPTLLARATVDACPACGHEQERLLGTPDAVADPGACPRCNP